MVRWAGRFRIRPRFDAGFAGEEILTWFAIACVAQLPAALDPKGRGIASCGLGSLSCKTMGGRF